MEKRQQKLRMNGPFRVSHRRDGPEYQWHELSLQRHSQLLNAPAVRSGCCKQALGEQKRTRNAPTPTRPLGLSVRMGWLVPVVQEPLSL